LHQKVYLAHEETGDSPFFVSKRSILQKGAKKQNVRAHPGLRDHRVGSVNEQKVAQEVTLLAQPLCEAEGVELIHIEFQREPSGRILRVYIDKPGGIYLEDCVALSRQLTDILDVKLGEIGPYHLEVTSPGPDRPLSRKQDFEAFKGSSARIKTNRPFNGQRNFKGILLGISGERVNLQIGDQTIAIPYGDIIRARLAS
jgi:ribosome maturation factor RimP